MKNINLEKTQYTPKIDLNSTNGIVDIFGDSYPEDSFDFYEDIKEWFNEYFKSPQKLTTINLNLPYMNSSSLKVFFDIFEIFEKALKNGSTIEINWIYDEDNDISEEMGEDFQLDFENLNIKLISENN